MASPSWLMAKIKLYETNIKNMAPERPERQRKTG